VPINFTPHDTVACLVFRHRLDALLCTAAESVHEDFGLAFAAGHFFSPTPNKNTSVSSGVL
jgi:hypothetical protein